MSVNRFYIPPAQWNPEALSLNDDEAHHCRDVFRHREGDKVVAFNGVGAEATAHIRSMSKDAIALDVQSVVKTPPLAVQITLAQALIKGKNMDLIFQKATELGAARIVPLLSERSIVRLDAEEKARKTEKWQRIVIEACKQSGQNWLPEVTEPVTMEALFASKPSEEFCLLASLEPVARSLRQLVAEFSEMNGRTPAKALAVVGPEGDFTPAEMAVAQRGGCLPWTLGPIVLRSETAALYSLSILGYELGQ